MTTMRTETDSLGAVQVPADKLWGAQTQRSLEHFSIGQDLIPREMIAAYAILKKAAANANRAGKRLEDERHGLIVQVCDEILAGQHADGAWSYECPDVSDDEANRLTKHLQNLKAPNGMELRPRAAAHRQRSI